MAELTTLARPYAQAVFELALEKKKLQAWTTIFRDLVAVLQQPQIHALMNNVKISRAQLTGVFHDVCGEAVGVPAKNLLALLIQNGRLKLLPEISNVYEVLRAEAESVLEAKVISAFPLTPAQEAEIAAALKVRLGRDIKIKTIIDKTVLGGAIVRAGDLVIDGSVNGSLAKFSHALNQ